MKKKAEARKKTLFDDRRYHKVISFFVCKGLLVTNIPLELHKGKLAIADVIWVAENCEPRVWEVLPAALIRFPAAFVGTDKLPAEFLKFVAKIQKGEIPIAEFHGIRGQDMARWANFPLRDRRTKPISQKRVMKAFRLPKSSLKKLKSFAQKNKITETEAIERLLAQL